MRSDPGGLALSNGSRIAILGAGPAGAFFAGFALTLARQKGLDLSIVVSDGKDFTRSGPLGCNLCAGVISETLVKDLDKIGISLQEERVQRRIAGYDFHVRAGRLELRHPQNSEQITTVFRGNGPRFFSTEASVSFDDYLLDHVRSRGVTVVPKLVRRIELSEDPRQPVRVVCDRAAEESVFEADLLVVACGLNTHMLNAVADLGFGYRPPHTLTARCLEIHLGADWIETDFGNEIIVCNWRTHDGSRLAAVIPKKDYVTVNVIGQTNISILVS